VGNQAGNQLVTGSGNIYIGNNLGFDNENDTIRIGDFQTNAFIAGIYGTTVASGTAVYIKPNGQLGTLTSSERFKQDIRTMGDASDVLWSLRPVTFQYNSRIDPRRIPQFGLIAEEVDKVDPDLVIRDDQHGVYTVRYEAVNVMLLNEFLKQHRTANEQKREIGRQKEQIASLEARLDRLEQIFNSKIGGAR